MDLGHPDCDGLSDTGKVRAVNEDQFVAVDARGLDGFGQAHGR